MEDKYLHQNSDGTFSIKEIAMDEIGKELFYELKNAMEQVNQLISKNALQFYENGKIKQINDNIINDIFIENRISNGYGEILSNYGYCSNYEWYW